MWGNDREWIDQRGISLYDGAGEIKVEGRHCRGIAVSSQQAWYRAQSTSETRNIISVRHRVQQSEHGLERVEARANHFFLA